MLFQTLSIAQNIGLSNVTMPGLLLLLLFAKIICELFLSKIDIYISKNVK